MHMYLPIDHKQPAGPTSSGQSVFNGHYESHTIS